MKTYRMSKGVTEHYTSFEELRAAWNCKNIKRKTNDEVKLKAQQDKLVGVCKVCKQNLTWINGTNICACQNPECKGIKMTKINEDGTEKTWYVPVVKILDEKGTEIAKKKFI